MRTWVFLSLLVVVTSAPLDDQNTEEEVQQDDEKVNLVKRAQEVMMFGNQQNDLSNKDKRSDLAESIDKQGELVAEPPVNIAPEVISLGENEPETQSLEVLPVDGNMLNDPDIPEEDAGSEEEIVPQEEEEELQAGEEEVPVDDDEVGSDGEEDKETSHGDVTPETVMYDKFLNKYDKGNDNYLMDLLSNQYGALEPSYPSSYNLYDYLTTGRYRRSHVPSIYRNPKSRILKRAHRNKRDLYFTSDILGRNYNPYSDSRYVNTPYDNDQPEVDEEDIRYLLSLLSDTERYDEDTPTGYDEQLSSPYLEYLGPEMERDGSDIYVPKRQAGLTFVPGIKRSREFFPYFPEPQSHFSAFVPQKRSLEDYAEAYQRLMELAAELRAESYYPQEEYELENYFRRK